MLIRKFGYFKGETMSRHDLKCHSEYFLALKQGLKSFECRYNDRCFQVDDILVLREYNPESGYTGSFMERRIVYILTDFIGFVPGYVILGII